MNKIKITVIALFFIPLSGFAQDEKPLTNKEKRKNRTTYRGLNYLSLGVGSFRDFATSPLTYSGIALTSGGFKLKVDDERETKWGAPITVGFFGTSINDHSSSSTLFSFSPYYSKLYQLKSLSSENLNVKIGGMLQATMNLRTNIDLANNGVGLEIIPTLFGSVQGTWDVSRRIDKDKKFLFFKYKALKRKKSLAFRLNTGLVNSSYRNGFAYSGQAFLLNEPDIFDGYEFKVFSGFRMGSSLDYTLYSRKTTNAVQISYVWDALRTGGNLDKFEMAQHAIRLTLLFNTQ